MHIQLRLPCPIQTPFINSTHSPFGSHLMTPCPLSPTHTLSDTLACSPPYEIQSGHSVSLLPMQTRPGHTVSSVPIQTYVNLVTLCSIRHTDLTWSLSMSHLPCRLGLATRSPPSPTQTQSDHSLMLSPQSADPHTDQARAFHPARPQAAWSAYAGTTGTYA